jgi:hypothetical protein
MQAYTTCQPATMEFAHWWVDGESHTTVVVEPTWGLGACGLGMKISGTVCSTSTVGTCTKVFPCRALSWHSVALAQLSFWGCGETEEIQSPVPYPHG